MAHPISTTVMATSIRHQAAVSGARPAVSP